MSSTGSSGAPTSSRRAVKARGLRTTGGSPASIVLRTRGVAPRKALALLAGLALIAGALVLSLLSFSADGGECGSVLSSKSAERPCHDGRVIRGFGSIVLVGLGGFLVYVAITRSPYEHD